jgi:uncharacterized membrane protein YeaQ/YmgE (transglycosylase-associated protein family)
MMAIITWICFGLFVGLIARALYPGRQAMGFLATMILGIVGSLVGGLLAWTAGFGPIDRGPFDGSGWIMSIVGAMLVVWASLLIANRSRTVVKT